MNNLEWYTKVTQFCKAHTTCTECPFYLMQIQEADLPFEDKQCFTSKQALEQLSFWLGEPSQQEEDLASYTDMEDNQWLKDLLKGQFEDDEQDIDALYLQDDFI